MRSKVRNLIICLLAVFVVLQATGPRVVEAAGKDKDEDRLKDCRAYYHPTQQAFLEAHELAFDYFGGVFRRLRYDNLKSAVKKVLRG